MITVRLNGGLGNQMFQYATARALALSTGQSLLLDASIFTYYDVHPLKINRLSIAANLFFRNKFLDKLLHKGFVMYVCRCFSRKKRLYLESDLSFDSRLFSITGSTNLIGYFQSEKYFVSYRDVLLSELKPKKKLDGVDLEYFNQIETQSDNDGGSVSIHLRRGDYVSNDAANKVHGVCGLEYFASAIEYMMDTGVANKNTQVFIFSDDIEWCEENLKLDLSLNYIKGSSSPEVDMYLMSQCNHQIISNSTFSWWGAWLNEYEGKVVVAPKKWFSNESMISRDLVPKNWIRL